MSKAFTKETDADDDDGQELPPLPVGTKNYMTPGGYARAALRVGSGLKAKLTLPFSS